METMTKTMMVIRWWRMIHLFPQVSFSSAHLQECFSTLSRDVIGRERSNFLFYSLFYEHLLQQETELLHQREQVNVSSFDQGVSPLQ